MGEGVLLLLLLLLFVSPLVFLCSACFEQLYLVSTEQAAAVVFMTAVVRETRLTCLLLLCSQIGSGGNAVQRAKDWFAVIKALTRDVSPDA